MLRDMYESAMFGGGRLAGRIGGLLAGGHAFVTVDATDAQTWPRARRCGGPSRSESIEPSPRSTTRRSTSSTRWARRWRTGAPVDRAGSLSPERGVGAAGRAGRGGLRCRRWRRGHGREHRRGHGGGEVDGVRVERLELGAGSGGTGDGTGGVGAGGSGTGGGAMTALYPVMEVR